MLRPYVASPSMFLPLRKTAQIEFGRERMRPFSAMGQGQPQTLPITAQSFAEGIDASLPFPIGKLLPNVGFQGVDARLNHRIGRSLRKVPGVGSILCVQTQAAGGGDERKTHGLPGHDELTFASRLPRPSEGPHAEHENSKARHRHGQDGPPGSPH